jgi:hypothetical protein
MAQHWTAHPRNDVLANDTTWRVSRGVVRYGNLAVNRDSPETLIGRFDVETEQSKADLNRVGQGKMVACFDKRRVTIWSRCELNERLGWVAPEKAVSKTKGIF